MAADRERPLAEWMVLGLLAEQPSHGFALARLLAPGGEVGRVWAASRPLTYRAIDQLAADGLIEPVRTEPGHGPQRTVHELTTSGREALADWLRTPVPRFRDVRATLLAKLLLLERSGRSTKRLLAAQRRTLRAAPRRGARHADRRLGHPVATNAGRGDRGVPRRPTRAAARRG